MKAKLLLTILSCGATFFSFSQSGLIGSYPFNGNANDISGNGNNGTVVGATLTNDKFGNPNSAYHFNGINNYIDLGNNFSYYSHSFVCWARRDSTLGNTLISKINNGPYDKKNSEFYINSFTIGTGTAWNSVYSSDTAVDFKQWNCFVATYNSFSGIAKIYINGIVDSAYVGTCLDVANTPLYIGARPYWSGNGGPSFFFDGAIDEVKIYNRELSQHEVDSLCMVANSITESMIESIFKISPNPFTEQTTITVSGLQSKVSGWELELYDVYGRELKNWRLETENCKLERGNLANGIYFLRLSDGEKVLATEKLVISDY